MNRVSTGLPQLDAALGGGLLPGTLTVVAGATGIGKTQLGLHFANEGLKADGRRGVVFDMLARGDSQGHAAYAKRMFDWTMGAWAPEEMPAVAGVFEPQNPPADYFAAFDTLGRRVTRADLTEEQWREWNMEFQRRLGLVMYFFYGAFIHGSRRVVFDGVEPSERKNESAQQEMFEYVYHQVLRKDPAWLARELFRADFRANEARIESLRYDPKRLASMFLLTDRETMLGPMMERPIEEGDLLANANTVIYMGKIREEGRMARGLYIAKHRASACSEAILPFRIGEHGIEFED